jgi:hypothetical protein
VVSQLRTTYSTQEASTKEVARVELMDMDNGNIGTLQMGLASQEMDIGTLSQAVDARCKRLVASCGYRTHEIVLESLQSAIRALSLGRRQAPGRTLFPTGVLGYPEISANST